MPLRGGPSLVLASAPTSWQGEHKRRNTCSPAAASCAKAAPVEAARTMHATAQLSQVLIIVSSFTYLQTEMLCQNRAGFAPPFEWRQALPVSRDETDNLPC